MRDAALEQLANSFFETFYLKRWQGADKPDFASLTLNDAYRVQGRVAEMRVARGESLAGYKVGCTSSAIREQFGLSEPILAPLFRPHTRAVNGSVDWRHFANCAIEPEMVLQIGRDLQGENVPDNVLVDAIDFVSPGIELHDFTFWHQPPTTQELICSGGVHAGLLIGNAKIAPSYLNFRSEEFAVLIDGQQVTSARACEIMGSPLNSLRWLVSSLTRSGSKLHAGELVIPGSPVELVVIERDCKLAVCIETVGKLTVDFRS